MKYNTFLWNINCGGRDNALACYLLILGHFLSVYFETYHVLRTLKHAPTVRVTIIRLKQNL